MCRITFVLLIVQSITFQNFEIPRKGSATTTDQPKPVLEESSLLCDPKRPNIFVDRNNLLGKKEPDHKIKDQSGYSYGNGPYGPAHWAKLFKECGGKHQSPIDIVLSTLRNVHLDRLTWDPVYSQMPETITVTNNGKTVVVKPTYSGGKQAKIHGGPLPGTYTLDHIHFHWGSSDHKGSEHTVNGKSFPMEMHAVHVKEQMSLEQAAKAKEGIAVVGYLFEIDEVCNKAIGSMEEDFDQLEWDAETRQPLRTAFPMAELAEPFCYGYVSYKGSLTTPPCTENVLWMVSPHTLSIQRGQLEKFRRLYDTAPLLVNNFRPVQALNGRALQFVW